jgi:hypothetical protein
MSVSSAANAVMVDRSGPAAPDHEGPNVLSYRRPDDAPAEYSSNDFDQREALPPVVLRLPDLDEPLPSADRRDWVATLEPVITKILLGAIAVLGLVLLVLMWRGVGSSTVKASVKATPERDTSARPLDKKARDPAAAAKSTTPVAPFRLPMVETPAQTPPSNHAPVEWPSEQNAVPENPQQQTQNTLQADVPPDMPRYAPSTARPEQGPDLGAAALHGQRPPDHVADQRAAIGSPQRRSAGQPGVARFKDTIDTPNLEPSYDGTRSRIR